MKMTRTARIAALLLAGFGSAVIGLAATARAADPASCKVVKMTNPGWSDIASTNAMAGTVLKALGYEQKIDTLSVPITYQALKNHQINVFLGNWMPAQTKLVTPFLKTGAIKVVQTNLQGVKFTLAVPSYVSAVGVATFADLEAHAKQFGRKIYGIEPGAPANANIRRMLDAHAFGLTGWKLVSSSEQGMLAQVKRAVARHQWIVFLAWEPHPMNTMFKLTYLSGGHAYFGPHYGAATIYTVASKGYLSHCPNLRRLFSQMRFTVTAENTIMASIAKGAKADKAAADYLRTHPALVTPWLAGVTTLSGANGQKAVMTALK